MKIMDFRSDTVTRPYEEMRRVMACAEVGDDIYGDDPSSNALSKYAAEITGKEAPYIHVQARLGNLLAFLSADAMERASSQGSGPMFGMPKSEVFQRSRDCVLIRSMMTRAFLPQLTWPPRTGRTTTYTTLTRQYSVSKIPTTTRRDSGIAGTLC